MLRDLFISLSSFSSSFISGFSSESLFPSSTSGSLSAHALLVPLLFLPLPLVPRPLLPPRPRPLPRPLPRFISLFFFSMVLESLMVPGWHPRAASRKTACTCPMNGQCIYLAHVPVDVCESFFLCMHIYIGVPWQDPHQNLTSVCHTCGISLPPVPPALWEYFSAWKSKAPCPGGKRFYQLTSPPSE